MFEKNLIVNNLYVYLAVFSAFFISYIPLVYILDYISISKNLAYFIFIVLSFVVILFYIYMERLQVSKESIVMLVLSLFFATYAAISHSLTTNYFNDYQTLIVLSLLNPLYILQATLLADKKKHIVLFIYGITSVYFIFVTILWLKGDLVPEKDTIFIQVFDVVDAEYYQNVNKYLGLMCILTLGVFTQRSWLINILKTTLVVLSIFFMLKIGGRAAIVALGIVLVFWFLLLRIKLESMYFILSLVIVIITSYVLLLSLDKLIILMQESSINSINRFANLLMDSDSSHREFLFTKALEQFTHNSKNLFFGGGMNSFSVFTKEYNIDVYPHNIFLELLAEYGAIGFIIFMLPVFYLFKIRRERIGSYVGNDPLNRLFFMIFLYFFIIQMFNGSLRNIWFFTFITFLLLPIPKKKPLIVTS
ncbi:MAG: O-antigen ligase family protein [Thiotrichaceae bacterium]